MDKRPGFMAYFEEWHAIQSAVTPERGWKIFVACLQYAENGERSETENDPIVSAFFQMLRPGIDRGIVAYAETCRRNRYNRYKGICKQRGIDSIGYDEWCTEIDDRQRLSTSVTNSNRTGTKLEQEQELNGTGTELELNGTGTGTELTTVNDRQRPLTTVEDFEEKRKRALEMLEKGGPNNGQ